MDSVTVAFTGDIAFNHYFSLPISDPLLEQPIIDFLASSDHCVGNIEGPFFHPESGEAPEFRHHSDSGAAGIIREWGVDIWNLANNHALDFGSEGIKSSIDLAARLGCQTLGAGTDEEQASAPILLPEGGGVGVFSVSYPEKKMKGIEECAYSDWDNTDVIRSAVEGIKKECRWCVMIIHGGEEFSDMPMPETRKRYLSYLDMGVDVIVGHHPHVVQNYEIRGGKIIFYSLGNFIFDTNYQRNQVHTDVGELLKITFRSDSFAWDHLPVRIDRENGRVMWTEKDPVVFADIREKEYGKLWRCAAKGYYRAERRVRVFLNPEKYRGYSALRWLRRDMSLYRAGKDRSRIAGRYLPNRIGLNKKEKEIKAYAAHT